MVAMSNSPGTHSPEMGMHGMGAPTPTLGVSDFSYPLESQDSYLLPYSLTSTFGDKGPPPKSVRTVIAKIPKANRFAGGSRSPVLEQTQAPHLKVLVSQRRLH